jgi:hypothetical protein
MLQKHHAIEWIKPTTMYIGEYYIRLFETALQKREFLIGWLVQSFKQKTPDSYKRLKKSRLVMVVTYYDVKACNFQIVSETVLTHGYSHSLYVNGIKAYTFLPFLR